jgi:rubrerythrin
MPPHAFESVADIIAFAIEREKEAAEGYGRMAGLAATPGLKEMLLSLRGEEESHRELLEGLTDAQIAELSPGFTPDLGIVDLTVEEPLAPDMTLQDLLLFAARKEKKAVELYEKLAGMAGSDAQRGVFEFLAGQERTHKLKIEAEYEKFVMPEN